MTTKQRYHLKDANGYAGQFLLTEEETEKLQEKGWEISKCVQDTVVIKRKVTEHYHLIDSKGAYQGARLLGWAEAHAMRELGFHLVHVGDGSKDMDEVRAIRRIIE